MNASDSMRGCGEVVLGNISIDQPRRRDMRRLTVPSEPSHRNRRLPKIQAPNVATSSWQKLWENQRV